MEALETRDWRLVREDDTSDGWCSDRASVYKGDVLLAKFEVWNRGRDSVECRITWSPDPRVSAVVQPFLDDIANQRMAYQRKTIAEFEQRQKEWHDSARNEALRVLGIEP